MHVEQVRATLAPETLTPTDQTSSRWAPEGTEVRPAQFASAEARPALKDLIAEEDTPWPPANAVNDDPVIRVGILVADGGNNRESGFDSLADAGVGQV